MPYTKTLTTLIVVTMIPKCGVFQPRLSFKNDRSYPQSSKKATYNKIVDTGFFVCYYD